MTRRLPYGETVTRLRAASATDEWGNTTPTDWTDPDRLVITDCALSPLSQPEVRDQGRDAIPGVWTLYLGGRLEDIHAHDRIETRYGTFDVDGEPSPWRSPYTGREGMTVALRRIEG